MQYTPVIVVTSSTAEADRAAAQRLGAEAYFQKPNNLTAYMELGALIKRILAPHSNRALNGNVSYVSKATAKMEYLRYN